MSVEKWTKIALIILIKQLPNIVKSMSISHILSGRTIRKAEYDRIFKIIPSCARFRKIAKIDFLLKNNLCLSLIAAKC